MDAELEALRARKRAALAAQQNAFASVLPSAGGDATGLSASPHVGEPAAKRARLASPSRGGADLDKELGDTGLRTRLREFRDEARKQSVYSELEQMKKEVHGSTLPESADRARTVEPIVEPSPASA